VLFFNLIKFKKQHFTEAGAISVGDKASNKEKRGDRE
jgi:hypothetical protein